MMADQVPYLTRARKAAKLAKAGKTNVEIKVAMNLGYASEASRMVEIAHLDQSFEANRLTSDELQLLRIVAHAQRNGLERGETCSPKLKYCSAPFWPRSRPAYLAYKRLGTHRAGEDTNRPGTGLALLQPYNGYVRLTRAGWALVHALEALEGTNNGR
jgi:hypothetical protein